MKKKDICLFNIDEFRIATVYSDEEIEFVKKDLREQNTIKKDLNNEVNFAFEKEKNVILTQDIAQQYNANFSQNTTLVFLQKIDGVNSRICIVNTMVKSKKCSLISKINFSEYKADLLKINETLSYFATTEGAGIEFVLSSLDDEKYAKMITDSPKILSRKTFNKFFPYHRLSDSKQKSVIAYGLAIVMIPFFILSYNLNSKASKNILEKEKELTKKEKRFKQVKKDIAAVTKDIDKLRITISETKAKKVLR